MICELAALSCPLLTLETVAVAAYAWMGDEGARGDLLGCWRTELGTLGRLLILRSFETHEDMTAERRRALLSTNPFRAEGGVTSVTMDTYLPFPFLPRIRTGNRGDVYEVRTYRLRPGGLAPTLAGWEAAIEPAREYTDHLVTAMYALDGEPRITHIWAFGSLEERAGLRSRAYGAGVWPPKGGPEQILEATATIALSQGDSPLA